MIPLTTTKPPQTRPPWRVTPPGSLRRQCKRAWETYKEVRQIYGRCSLSVLERYGSFCKLNKEVHSFVVRSQSSYEHFLIDKWKNIPKLPHAYIGSKKSAPTTVGPLRLKDNPVSSDPKVMSECLAEAFCSVYAKGVPNTQEPHQSFSGNLPEIQITVEEVTILLHWWKCSNGSWWFAPSYSKKKKLSRCSGEAHAYYIYPLTGRGTIAKGPEKSLVILIFKKGPRLDPLNIDQCALLWSAVRD